MSKIREVWKTNYAKEMKSIDVLLKRMPNPFIAIDTEFPGFLRNTPRDASEERLYEDMKENVEKTKLIQFGFTLFDAKGRIGCSWEVNFSNFGDTWDARNQDSIEFLLKNGLNLKKIREDGVDMKKFFHEFYTMLKIQGRNLTWVTFHGNYDLAYMVNILTGRSLPETPAKFAEFIGRFFGSVYDLKDMTSRHRGLGSYLGLQTLGLQLGIQRVGSAHHAGPDSLLTALVFIRMTEEFKDLKETGGFIYGISTKVVSRSSDTHQKTWCYNGGDSVSRHPVSYSYNGGDSVSYHPVSYSYNGGDSVSYHPVSYSYNDGDSYHPVSYSYNGLASYDPQMCYNDGTGIAPANPQMCYNDNNNGLVSYPQTPYSGFSHQDPQVFCSNSTKF